jgi:hypothetical protein
MTRRSALVVEALGEKPKGRAPSLTIVAEEVGVMTAGVTVGEPGEPVDADESVVVVAAPASAKTPATTDVNLWRRARNLGDTTPVTINVPRALLTRIDELSKARAGDGREYARGVNKNALLNAAAERVATNPAAHNQALPLEQTTRLAGEIPDGLYDQVLAAVWTLDPKPATHGPLLAAAISQILAEHGA